MLKTINSKALLEEQLKDEEFRKEYEVLEEESELQDKDFSAPKHTGVRALFNQHFVKTGIVNVDIDRFFNKMFDFRKKGDYQDFIYFLDFYPGVYKIFKLENLMRICSKSDR